jgi:hypothetical protein
MTPFEIALLAVTPVAVGIGIWAGLRRARQLRAIARDRLGPHRIQTTATVDLKMIQSPTTVRPFFRALGFVAGPLMLLGGVAFLGMSFYALMRNGAHGWWSGNWEFTVTGIACLALGILITRAAVTGHDPYFR